VAFSTAVLDLERSSEVTWKVLALVWMEYWYGGQFNELSGIRCTEPLINGSSYMEMEGFMTTPAWDAMMQFISEILYPFGKII